MTHSNDTAPDDDHRGMARRAGYNVDEYYGCECNDGDGWYVRYIGPDPARRALRDVGPFDNESDAWARAISQAIEHRDGA